MRFELLRRADGSCALINLNTGQGEPLTFAVPGDWARKVLSVEYHALPSHKICLTGA